MLFKAGTSGGGLMKGVLLALLFVVIGGTVASVSYAARTTCVQWQYAHYK